MASSSDVSVRMCMQEIIKYDLEVKALIQDVGECRGPHRLLMELNGAVKKKCNHLRQRIQDVEQMAKEQDKETDKNIILAETECHRKQMLSNQKAWRKANLACKLAIDNLEKDELLLGGEMSVRQRKATKENLVETSSDITESLLSISRMMAQQVKQSEDSISTLDQDYFTGSLQAKFGLFINSDQTL
ncbi:vesicle transport protein SEC20 isoform X2 [Tachysurus vachellii]|uniref:vesicle transport protein SEC20 isoform X2 n=1 Tax=Tachysurus vachellii TaxID=175792 RepID=UPI00296B0941|nr:vesicle transport protein SEC20 isoform X2 [Tachysurus vachellii]